MNGCCNIKWSTANSSLHELMDLLVVVNSKIVDRLPLERLLFSGGLHVLQSICCRGGSGLMNRGVYRQEFAGSGLDLCNFNGFLPRRAEGFDVVFSTSRG